MSSVRLPPCSLFPWACFADRASRDAIEGWLSELPMASMRRYGSLKARVWRQCFWKGLTRIGNGFAREMGPCHKATDLLQ